MDFEPRLTILHQAGMLSEEDCRKVQDVIRFFQKNYPQVEVQIFDGNYDEIRDWIIHGPKKTPPP